MHTPGVSASSLASGGETKPRRVRGKLVAFGAIGERDHSMIGYKRRLAPGAYVILRALQYNSVVTEPPRSVATRPNVFSRSAN